MSLDSAAWYLEAGINFSLAQAWLECNEHYFASTEVFISCGNDGIIASTVGAAFIELSDAVSPMITPEVNHLILSDASFHPAREGCLPRRFFNSALAMRKPESSSPASPCP